MCCSLLFVCLFLESFQGVEHVFGFPVNWCYLDYLVIPSVFVTFLLCLVCLSTVLRFKFLRTTTHPLQKHPQKLTETLTCVFQQVFFGLFQRHTAQLLCLVGPTAWWTKNPQAGWSRSSGLFESAVAQAGTSKTDLPGVAGNPRFCLDWVMCCHLCSRVCSSFENFW